MLPLADGIPARRFPIINVVLIAANVAVFILYELPHLGAAVYHASFYPCSVDGACRAPLPWGLSWITAMFLHGSSDHILGNMLFLAIFGKNVEDAFGPVRYLVFYFAGGASSRPVRWPPLTQRRQPRDVLPIIPRAKVSKAGRRRSSAR
jgi:membrane associated rhomboid family serine protease